MDDMLSGGRNSEANMDLSKRGSKMIMKDRFSLNKGPIKLNDIQLDFSSNNIYETPTNNKRFSIDIL